jgi:DNA uptake protein ComE-like DNA-binding protein
VWSPSVPRSQWLAITLVAAAIFLTLLLRLHRRGQPPPPPGPLPIVVEVQGDVQSAGVYLLLAPATAREAIAAAGGCRSGYRPILADPWSEQRLASGARLHITCPPQGPLQIRQEPMDAAARLTLGDKLDLNQASTAELCLVPGMQTPMAEAIVARRHTRPWQDLPDLLEISGVGPKTLEKWASYLEARSASPLPSSEQGWEKPAAPRAAE